MLDGIEFERHGIPTAVICTDQFISSATTMARIQGLPGYPVLFTEHPVSSLDPDAVAERARALAPRVLEILREGQAQPAAPARQTAPAVAERLTYADALAAMDDFQARGWTDGLPVVPPTPERVAAFLAAGRRDPAEIIGVNRVRRRTITAEKVAINAVMAGCAPEYAPIVFTVAAAMLEETFNIHGPAASMAGAAVLVIVNGPVVQELGFNHAASLFGPGYRPNATVGRFTRLLLMNGLGALPNVFDKSTFGHPGKYSYCIAEDERSAPDWTPLHVMRGAPPGSSAITVDAAMAPVQLFGDFVGSVATLINRLARTLVVLSVGQSGNWVLVISPEHAMHFRRAGYTKERIQHEMVERTAELAQQEGNLGQVTAVQGGDYANDFLPLARPENLLVMVGGGGAGPGCVLIPPWGTGRSSIPVTRVIS